ncbi:MAG: Pseudouridine synthase [Candidatus Magasanikbacteria bacterium GW2011_GWA2_56_11]|uniref:Pseudouridine synthase n=1 Tax=Candidatus Magasanikbacteria bacterium GW2011_GWA2_56_11 TaxID=1619044 RepID=A0A0G1YGQ4_9BACT|nr:MAG: Pseudouridine synthase [Candidatus Magasanikbacteria bacterium GW2011_GWA2_56_11]
MFGAADFWLFTMPETFTVPDSVAAERLDRWLAGALGISRSQAERLIDNGAVTLNGKLPRKAGDQVVPRDTVAVDYSAVRSPGAATADKPPEADRRDLVRVVFETADYVVVDKPSGLAAHPPENVADRLAIETSATLSGWVLSRYPETWGVGEYANRPGMPHRLDKDASGLMVIARRQGMFSALKRQFKERTVEKHYYALAHGAIEADTGTIDFPLDRGPDGRMVARPRIESVTLKNVASLQPGKAALTEFTVLKRFVNFTFLEVRIHSGRTHQIRVHFFAYNHPLVGDPLYFNKKLRRDKDKELGRIFLHAHSLAFADLSGERAAYESRLPAELQDFLTGLPA